MYHFNPIEDCSLFNKMETQHLYNKEESHKKNGMIEYIHWYPIEYSELNNNESNECIQASRNQKNEWNEQRVSIVY